ncbi:unnamed protein product [Rotaria sordida]|uniref:G-protein coupled receptors family 1 profile domain-containing protein n=1 Tax=Rotaria sordida TaxID=392033 RepID=A0A819GC84_9BILA|nr:unnamed protein product [Rotaria sordida]
MNSTMNSSLLMTSTCSIKHRILLNTLCLFVLSRPRLSDKSTTVIFLRFLAIFDILAITLKYIRAELNYQSIEKKKDIIIITSVFCKTLYVGMNASISITMWTIVLMSLDKVVAVSYPFKAGIWITQKRAFYVCCFTSLLLLIVNLHFITLSGVRPASNNQKYCGLMEDSSIIDILTASVLPIAINIAIGVILYRTSQTSFNSYTNEYRIDLQSLPIDVMQKELISARYRCQSPPNSSLTTDTNQAIKRRTNAQVTRMLLAVTLSLIICYIPNTIIFLHTRINNSQQLLNGRSCFELSDNDIKIYKIKFYSIVIQDILSDLPHIINFFLYCLAGKKFRSIFQNEVYHCFIQNRLIQRRHQQCFIHYGSLNREFSNPISLNFSQRRVLSGNISLESQKATTVSFNTLTNKLIFNDENHNKFINENDEFLQPH